ncbi:MAG: T9SS type A sorting domain-containing protein, partial [Cyclobacteriaceae bacterium]|nr:T9SS type A sorting domain-containing protein [Cyclobacteriaceae bacterium]
LSYAKEDITLIADENSYQPGDTLKALGTVKLKGQVLKADGQVNSGFSGSLIATVFDKPTEIETYGHEDPVMRFLVRDNIIFKGEVSVTAGEFDIEFIVPKNITYDFEKGKVSLYALDVSQHLDAGGSNIEFAVGGESEDYEVDTTPPEIQLFINDTSFVNGGITRPDILLVGNLSDESGISISNSDSGQELIAVLDNEEEITVNGYYVSAIDTYKKGWVTYPFKDLSIGTHKIRLKAWDIHNNSNEAEIEFLVVEDAYLAIEKLMNFPNPFRDYTRFSFEHNRAGDDLEIMIDIYSLQGKLVKQFIYTRENSESRISDLVWDGKAKNGSILLSGVYIFRLSIRSLIDGSKKQANQKLVIIN